MDDDEVLLVAESVNTLQNYKADNEFLMFVLIMERIWLIPRYGESNKKTLYSLTKYMNNEKHRSNMNYFSVKITEKRLGNLHPIKKEEETSKKEKNNK